MMKHELEDQLKAFEKKGIDRRHSVSYTHLTLPTT